VEQEVQMDATGPDTAMHLSMEMVDRMSEGVGLTRCRDGVIVYGNPAVIRMFGYDHDALAGSPVTSLLPGGDKDSEERAARVMEHLKTHKAWNGEVENVRKDGSRFWTHLTVTTLNHPEHGEVWMGVYEDITDRKRIEKELQEANELLTKMSQTDDLTGLPNRRCFLDTLSRELHRINRYGGETVVGIVDVDHFKVLNDTYGHTFGDHVLIELAKVLRAQVRQSDLVGRYAGDEIVVLMPNIVTAGAVNVIERIRAAFNGPLCTPEGTPVLVTFSAGLSPVSQNATPEAVLRSADSALYEAKMSGRNCTRIFLQQGKESSEDKSLM